MSRIQRHLKNREGKNKIARAVKRRLTFLIAFLIGILFLLMFRVGAAFWPTWMVAYRTQIEGIIALAVILLILLSPIIAEVSSSPRGLSGPGKNPEGPRLD